jgi:hypothetical protein
MYVAIATAACIHVGRWPVCGSNSVYCSVSKKKRLCQLARYLLYVDRSTSYMIWEGGRSAEARKNLVSLCLHVRAIVAGQEDGAGGWISVQQWLLRHRINGRPYIRGPSTFCDHGDASSSQQPSKSSPNSLLVRS